MNRLKSIALIWGTGFAFIGLGTLINYADPDYSALNYDQWYDGYYAMIAGFASVILAAIQKIMFGDRGETKLKETYTIAGNREFTKERVQTYLDYLGEWPVIVGLMLAGGFMYATPEIFHKPFPTLEGFGGFLLWAGLALLIWKGLRFWSK